MKYENRLIAFIDILGFKEIVRSSEKDSSKIEFLYSVLDYLKSWEIPENWNLQLVEIEEDAQKRGVENFDIRGKTNTTAFSDSIVVSVKVENNVNEMTSTLIVNLAYIGAILFEKGILFRGGITIGNLIHNEKGTVFGQGLIEAYQLETNSAKFPRIILSNKLIQKLNYPLETKRNRYPYHQYLERYEDGCVGFHQMIYFQVIESWTEMTNEKLKESLNIIRKVIIKGLDTSFENPRVYEKYIWLKTQYNNLIILSDFDFKTKTHENVKLKIRELNKGMNGHNVHYKYTDDFYESTKKK
ncbi:MULTISPECIES: hypothetical protein [Bizionia]|uniref:Guanylate cyclase domain-containing protein n=1 Tax=Bizionia algoritergicola TaxID=291187 RepID=A0A5D0QJL4_9FLAO|nr:MULTISPECIES: hypothetical protein [Bizionia]OBX17566.1 hypothetical protein BAA08_16105 [Bizionia sp. APA-3]TYB69452.1 hypothetical protein ES675_16200 [Bizionia algoritergicola]